MRLHWRGALATVFGLSPSRLAIWEVEAAARSPLETNPGWWSDALFACTAPWYGRPVGVQGSWGERFASLFGVWAERRSLVSLAMEPQFQRWSPVPSDLHLTATLLA